MLTIIFSNWSVNKIYNFLTDYLEADKTDIMYGKIERYKDENGEMKDTNKTLILMNPELYNKALAEGLDTEGDGLDFRIDQFHLSEKHLPKLHHSINFYIGIPQKISARDAEILICEKMNIFVKIGWIEENQYKLKIFLKSRLTEEHRGFAILSFSDYIDISVRSMIRILLDDSILYFGDKEIYYMSVYWANKKI